MLTKKIPDISTPIFQSKKTLLAIIKDKCQPYILPQPEKEAIILTGMKDVFMGIYNQLSEQIHT